MTKTVDKHSNQSFDIIILGGGMVALMLANLLREQPLKIAIVEPHEPKMQWQADDYPLRVSAINPASCQLFQHLNLWDAMVAQGATPFSSMFVWDACSDGKITFSAADIGVKDLGFIVPNRVMRKLLWHNLTTQTAATQVQFFCGTKAKQWVNLGAFHRLTLDDGTCLAGKLLIGADGAHSWLREQMGIVSKQGAYGQQAIVAVVKHALSHQNTAWQRFLKTGPLAFLPLQLSGEKAAESDHTSSIVWSCETQMAAKLLKLPLEEFNNAISAAFDYSLGAVTCLSSRAAYPLSYRHAKSYVTPGAALVGDAAHGIHPLAGQGVNLGYADVSVLADTIKTAINRRRNYADVSILRQYELQRHLHNEIMLQVMTGFDKLFSNDNQWLKCLRSMGLTAVDKVDLLKQCVINMHKTPT